ncbi:MULTISPECIES: hypothetical protein [unclassified Amycolatopsis]|uniref:hypothetical protein n=1 Tax=unclassified Amycolatopsis TaxID=2618356 RepID=UPI000F771E17|nr:MULTISPECIES: hypothetical protein [unclassified Amycolatopsis]
MFTVLAAELTPAEARAVLKGDGVVVDDEGTVLGTVTAQELAYADAETLASWRALPPAVEVHADQTFAQFADSSAVTLLLLGITRLVLTRDGTPVGLLPVARVTDYLASGAHPLPGNEMGPAGASSDGALPGRVRLAAAHVACSHCGYRNVLEHWNPRRPPRCANPDRAPHELELDG